MIVKVVCSRLPPQIGQVLAVQLIVQSGHRGPAFLDDRVESFLAQYRTELAGYSEDVLGGFVEAVCEKLTEKPKNIDQVCARRPQCNTWLWFMPFSIQSMYLYLGQVRECV
jgi:secreted Zn-dependent insulinase-like peptidase